LKPAWSWQFDPATLQPVCGVAADSDHPFMGLGRQQRGGRQGGGNRQRHRCVIPRGPLAGGAVIVADDKAPRGARVVESAHEDLFGQGTACAAITRQSAPDAELYSVRVLGERLTGRGIVLAGGMRRALTCGMQVLNMSLST
jgi:hypothetical protein